jgi:hypothetical protein
VDVRTRSIANAVTFERKATTDNHQNKLKFEIEMSQRRREKESRQDVPKMMKAKQLASQLRGC